MSLQLFVCNLPLETTEATLRTFFAGAGCAALDVTIMRDRFSSEPKGYAWVELETEAEAARALEQLRGAQFFGRTVVVAREREPREEAGGPPEAQAPGATV